MNRTTIEPSTSSRIGALALAAIVTLATLQSIDVLASRDHGQTFATRAAGQVITAATALRQPTSRS